jgi:hypothetical protein
MLNRILTDENVVEGNAKAFTKKGIKDATGI